MTARHPIQTSSPDLFIQYVMSQVCFPIKFSPFPTLHGPYSASSLVWSYLGTWHSLPSWSQGDTHIWRRWPCPRTPAPCIRCMTERTLKGVWHEIFDFRLLSWISFLPHCSGNPVYIFLFWELRGLSPISTFMCLWAIYKFPRSVHIFPPAEKADPSWEYIIRSQTHECGNWDWGPNIPFLGIFVSNFRHFVFAVRVSHWSHFEFLRKFAEIFESKGWSPVSTTMAVTGKNHEI